MQEVSEQRPGDAWQDRCPGDVRFGEETSPRAPGPSPCDLLLWSALPCPNLAVRATSCAPRKPSMRHTTSPSFLSQPSSHTVPQRRSWYTSTRPSCGPEPFTSRIINASKPPAGSSSQSLLCSGHAPPHPGTCPDSPQLTASSVGKTDGAGATATAKTVASRNQGALPLPFSSLLSSTFYFLLIDFFFSFFHFRVTAKLRGRYRDFLHIPCPQHASLRYCRHPSPRGASVAIDEPTLTCHYRPELVVYVRVALAVVHSVGLDKRTTTSPPLECHRIVQYPKNPL